MTSQSSTDESTLNQSCNAKDVETYLEKTPAFFQDHPSLLLDLTLPHPSGGAVSLIERQVALLRDENKQLRLRTKELVEIARENEVLVKAFHSLNMDLMTANSLDDFSETLSNKLKSDFNASHVSIKLFSESVPEGIENSDMISRSDKNISHFDKFLNKKVPVCGRFNSQQLVFLFGDKALEVKSLALIPLIDEKPVGMFAIASADADHFKAGMSTLLLSSLADVASAVLKRIAFKSVNNK